jgi:hypothetical protein
MLSELTVNRKLCTVNLIVTDRSVSVKEQASSSAWKMQYEERSAMCEELFGHRWSVFLRASNFGLRAE